MMPTNTDRIKIHCNICLGLRWHTVLFLTTRSNNEDLDDGFEYEEATIYRMAECNGCESVTLQTTWSSSGHPESIDEQWPPKVSRRQPKWMFDIFISEKIGNTFKHDFIQEIYSSLKSGNLRLTVLGVRALLEQIMLEHIGDQGSFAKNIQEFESSGFISRVQREAIIPVIEAGHASMHRGFKASEQQVEAILDITENIIESIYITKDRTTGLIIPPRKRRK
jgi:hypothetical protein